MQHVVPVRNRSRFVPPSSPGPVVSRDRLDPLYAQATGRILRVLAPPGYGKSTQVARWAGSDQRQVGWIDLEPIDNDPLVLASALATVLRFGAPEPVAWEGSLDRSALDEVTSHLAVLVEQAVPYVLVLDDVHNLDSAEAIAVLDAVVRHLPAGSTLVLCGRTHADRGTLARQRLRPGVVEVTASELALDAPETDELLREIGVELELDALSRLCDRFEGWVAGLLLAGQALKGKGDHTWMSADHVGDTAFVIDYLRSEWTGDLSKDDRKFLSEAACLQRFTGEMCDQVLGRTRSHARLRRIHHDQLLVLPLDQRDVWFRMHPLLTRWLSSDLQEADPDRWREIHASASAWWADHGDVDLALEHAMAIDDLAAAESLVTDVGFAWLARGLHSTVRRWLAAFPTERMQRSAGLCEINALNNLQLGDGARALRWYEHLERILDSSTSPCPPLTQVRAEVLRMTLAREPSRQLLPLAEKVIAELEADTWTALALYATGGLRFLAGDREAADAFEGAAFVAEINGLWLHQANCTSALGIVAELEGDRDCAADMARRAAELLTRQIGELPATTAMSDALQAVVAAREGRREDAARLIEVGQGKLRAFSSVAPWFNVLCGLAFARAAVRIDDRAASRALLRDLDQALRGEEPDHGAALHVEELRESVEAARQLPSDPAWALTDAELKVLRHLPTNLSLADIATRLFVSRNTVKSHVAAIYRKLNATSRSDAVELARKTGLLEDGPPEDRD